MGQVIATTGMGGVGKTTFSANLACGLADQEKVVIILSAELNFGNIQSFFGESIESDKGTFASLSDKTEQPEKMLVQCSKLNSNIYLMAIPNDNYEVHTAGLEDSKVEQLIRRLSMIADYLIIDCTSDFYNGITIMGIEKAHFVYCLYKATAGAMLWHRSMMPIISQLTEGEIYPVLSEHQMGCQPNAFSKITEIDIEAYIPNVVSAPIMENIGRPIYYDKDKTSQAYRKVISQIAEDIILGKGEENEGE